MKNECRCLLSKEMSFGMKGYLAVCVFIHHLYQCSGIFSETYTGYLFYILGRWASVVFAFLTGYGLYSSYKAKGNDYIKTFPKRRILSYYISYLVFFALYLLYFLIQGQSFTAKAIITSLTIGGTIIIYGWYLQMALVVYIVFWAAFRLFKNEYARSATILLLIGVFLGFCFYTGVIYYIPALSVMFVGGMLCSVHEEEILARLYRHRLAITISSFILFVFFSAIFMSYDVFGYQLPYWMKEYVIAVFAEIAEITFIISLMHLLPQKAEKLIVNPVGKFLGKHSMEIYACQGLFLNLIFSTSGNVYLLIILAIAITIIGSILVQPIISWIGRLITSLYMKYPDHY